MFLDLRQLFTHLTAYLHRVGTGLLGDDQTNGFAAVGLIIEREVLDGILDGSDVANEDLLALRGHSDHEVLYLRGLDIFGPNLHLVLLLRHLDRTRREVQVIRRNDLPHLLQRDAVRIQFLLVDIDIHIPVRRTREGDITDTVNMVQLRYYLVVENLIQTRVGLVSGNGIHGYRHR